MYIYLDDIRTPRTVKDWVICRNITEFKEAIIVWGKNANLHPDPDDLYISFDHDIDSYDKNGLEETGYDALKWFVQVLMNNSFKAEFISDCITINVHSANPIGKKNIEAYWQSFLKSL